MPELGNPEQFCCAVLDAGDYRKLRHKDQA
jgi:hypothetical protein